MQYDVITATQKNGYVCPSCMSRWLLSIGKNCPGFFMCVGNHIPSNTPVDSVLYYNEVYEELSRR